jgi:hypothetical protein
MRKMQPPSSVLKGSLRRYGTIRKQHYGVSLKFYQTALRQITENSKFHNHDFESETQIGV